MITRLQELLTRPDPALGYINAELRFWLGWAQEVAGDPAAAQQSWTQARQELESFVQKQPQNVFLMSDLALCYMGLGNKESAFSWAEKAAKAVPIQDDAVTGPIPVEIIGRVAARSGELERAITATAKVLAVPCDGALGLGVPITPSLLRLDPMFDSVRNDPKFQKLIPPKGQE
jgi:tetratricopeptide (TPR) repeat protein